MFNKEALEKHLPEKSLSDYRTIQPNGYMMVLNIDDFKIVQASANFSKLVVGGVETILGHTFEDLFGAQLAVNLRRRVNKEGRILMLISGNFHLFDQRKFNCLVQTVDKKIIIELEESLDSVEPTSDSTEALTDAVAAFGQANGLAELIQLIPSKIKRLTGFERVLVYKLDQHMTGKVVAEETTPGIEPLLNFRFPAEDISHETCKAYCKNTVRAIADTSYEPSPLVGGGQPVDLSNCTLAGVSANHIEQLRKNNIGASMSISIVCNGKLWGLVVCHNRAPKEIHHWLRSYCEVVGKLISLRISAYGDRADRILKDKLRRFFDGVRENPTRAALESELLNNAVTILELFDGKGMAIVSRGKTDTYPKAPEDIDISKYADWLDMTNQKNCFIEDNLRSKFPLEGMIETASGVITMSFPIQKLSLHIFRPELTQTLTWASALFMNVDKKQKTKPTFGTLRQTIEKHSVPWTLNQIFMAQVFFDSMKDVLATIDQDNATKDNSTIDRT